VLSASMIKAMVVAANTSTRLRGAKIQKAATFVLADARTRNLIEDKNIPKGRRVDNSNVYSSILKWPLQSTS
jgi:hypothetical protein